MKRIFLALFILLGVGATLPAQASPWPYYSFKITQCIKPDCSQVDYNYQETSWLSIADNIKSSVHTKELSIWGVHCGYGDRPGNFIDCYFLDPNVEIKHTAPLVDPAGCETTEADNWVIKRPDACVAQVNFSGRHVGALPGAECSILGKNISNSRPSEIDTPFGMLSAGMVANSRDTYCGKALEPPANCDITIPNGGLLDHGIQTPNSQSERTLDVTIDCGQNPEITIINPILKMDNDRIQSDLSITPNGTRTNYLLKSVLNTTNASEGEHSAVTVVVVNSN